MGFKRSIKPEIFFPGGRVFFRPEYKDLDSKVTLKPIDGKYGQKVASPGHKAGDLNYVAHMRGTSNSTALATRSGAMLYDILSSMGDKILGEDLSPTFISVLIKTLLVHSASWHGTQNELITAMGNSLKDHKKNKDMVCSLIGYGSADIEKVLFCTEQRVTLLGWANIGDDDAHIYSFPLPASLSSLKVQRKLTATLGWFSPVNPKHQNYKMANLWFAPYSSKNNEDGVQSILKAERKEAHWQTVKLGTVQHEIFEGDTATPFEFDAELSIQVNCLENAGKLREKVPYGIAVTLEVAPETRLPLYEEIQARIKNEIKIKQHLQVKIN